MLSISRSPLRVSLFGGGSDIEDYYKKHVGEVLSFSINKYVYVAINDKFEDGIRLSYSKTENVQNSFQLEHQICRNLLPIYNINSGIEIVTIADVPSRGSGLASSSAFTAALMANLNFRNKITKSKYELAKSVCDFEIVQMNSPIGKQDQYATVFGGLNKIKFYRSGKVLVSDIKLKPDAQLKLEKSILLVHTSIDRDASEILKSQNMEPKNLDELEEKKHKLVDMISRGINFIEESDFKKLGRLLSESWEIKKSLGKNISNDEIDQIYQKGLDLGAFGGKLLGAGAGGFMLFVCPSGRRAEIAEKLGLRYFCPKLEFEGTKVVNF